MPDDELERRDYEALLATRGELGPDYEKALVDSFADRMEQEIAAPAFHGTRRVAGSRATTRGATGSASSPSASSRSAPASRSPRSRRSISGLPGLIAAWAGIGVVNVAHALVVNRRRD